jgi:hypothetical protein
MQNKKEFTVLMSQSKIDDISSKLQNGTMEMGLFLSYFNTQKKIQNPEAYIETLMSTKGYTNKGDPKSRLPTEKETINDVSFFIETQTLGNGNIDAKKPESTESRNIMLGFITLPEKDLPQAVFNQIYLDRMLPLLMHINKIAKDKGENVIVTIPNCLNREDHNVVDLNKQWYAMNYLLKNHLNDLGNIKAIRMDTGTANAYDAIDYGTLQFFTDPENLIKKTGAFVNPQQYKECAPACILPMGLNDFPGAVLDQPSIANITRQTELLSDLIDKSSIDAKGDYLLPMEYFQALHDDPDIDFKMLSAETGPSPTPNVLNIKHIDEQIKKAVATNAVLRSSFLAEMEEKLAIQKQEEDVKQIKREQQRARNAEILKKEKADKEQLQKEKMEKETARKAQEEKQTALNEYAQPKLDAITKRVLEITKNLLHSEQVFRDITLNLEQLRKKVNSASDETSIETLFSTFITKVLEPLEKPLNSTEMPTLAVRDITPEPTPDSETQDKETVVMGSVPNPQLPTLDVTGITQEPTPVTEPGVMESAPDPQVQTLSPETVSPPTLVPTPTEPHTGIDATNLDAVAREVSLPSNQIETPVKTQPPIDTAPATVNPSIADQPLDKATAQSKDSKIIFAPQGLSEDKQTENESADLNNLVKKHQELLFVEFVKVGSQYDIPIRFFNEENESHEEVTPYKEINSLLDSGEKQISRAKTQQSMEDITINIVQQIQVVVKLYQESKTQPSKANPPGNHRSIEHNNPTFTAEETVGPRKKCKKNNPQPPQDNHPPLPEGYQPRVTIDATSSDEETVGQRNQNDNPPPPQDNQLQFPGGYQPIIPIYEATYNHDQNDWEAIAYGALAVIAVIGLAAGIVGTFGYLGFPLIIAAVVNIALMGTGFGLVGAAALIGGGLQCFGMFGKQNENTPLLDDSSPTNRIE